MIMNTQELLDIYYRGLARKSGWETVIADDFRFTGGDMTQREPLVGKEAYQAVISRFGKVFQDMRVKEMFVKNDRAFVLANYDYEFPGGRRVNGDVAEYWEIRNGQLAALTIYFDTLGFERFTKA